MQERSPNGEEGVSEREMRIDLMVSCCPPSYERQAEWNRNWVESSKLTESSPSRTAATFGNCDPNDPDVKVSKNGSGLGDKAPGTCATPSRAAWPRLPAGPSGAAADRS